MKPIPIPCSECHGTGTTDLPEHLAKTLDAMGRRSYTAEELADFWPRITTNAVNNRLSDLLRLGLVERERDGKFYVYTALPRPAKRDVAPARRSMK